MAARRRLFPVVDEMGLAIRQANQHETAATQISRLGMHHRQREADSYGGVHGIAARLHDLDSDPRRGGAHTGHHGPWRLDRNQARAGAAGGD